MDPETIYTVEHDGITIRKFQTESAAREYVEEIETEEGYGNALGTYHVTKWARASVEEEWEEHWTEGVRKIVP